MDFQLTIAAGPRPLTRQIYDQIRSAVLDGRLRRGERLPATRELANQLDISRRTVVVAYEMLLAGGIIATKPGSGTYVEDVGSASRRMADSASPVSIVPYWQGVLRSELARSTLLKSERRSKSYAMCFARCVRADTNPVSASLADFSSVSIGAASNREVLGPTPSH